MRTHPQHTKAWERWLSCASLLWFVAAACSGLCAQEQRTSRQNPCPAAATHDYWTPDGRSGDLEFDIPGGWERIKEETFELKPSGLQAKQVVRIGFLAPQTLTGSAHQYFQSVWGQWRRQFNMIDNGQPDKAHNPKGFDVLSQYTRIYSPALGNGTFRMGVAVLGKRAQAYYFVDNTGNIDYEEAFHGLEHSVQFVNREKPRLPEPGVPCGLNGIYVGWKKTPEYRNGVIFEGALKIEILVFFRDGNVIRHLPEKGLKNFDFGAELKESRDYCGRYRMIGDQFKITWADDTAVTGSKQGENLMIQDFSYQPAANSDGFRLNATYRTEGAPTGPRIRFSSDGQFVENGILDSVDYSGRNKAAGSGTYSIEQNTIELHYQNAHTVPLSFYVFASDQTGKRPKLIHLNSKAFVLAQ